MADRIHWKSLEELIASGGESPAPVRRRLPVFDDHACHADPAPGVSRRGFLQLVGGASALAGLAACQNAVEPALPYTRTPEGLVPSTPLHYASAFTTDGFATGVVVTAYEGRPTKVEGNERHPSSLGATSAWDQAATAELYDPDRARTIRRRGAPATRGAFLAFLRDTVARLQPSGGAGLRFLVEPDGSPLLASLRREIEARLPAARFHVWSPTASSARYEATRALYGRALEPRYDLTRADVVVALDADLAGTMPDALRHARALADGRSPDDGSGVPRSRLYVAEHTLSPTGMIADHRLRLRSSEIAAVAGALAARVAALRGDAGRPLAAALGAARLPPPPAAAAQWIDVAARDLAAAGPRALVVAGPRQPAAVHALAAAIDAALGAVAPPQGAGALAYGPPILDEQGGPGALATLVDDLQAGRVDTLVVTAWNPAYAGFADRDFTAAMARATHTIYLGAFFDETAHKAGWHVPLAHPLESWGDARSVDGTVALVQPLIEPLTGGWTVAELLAALLGRADRGARGLLLDRFLAERPGTEVTSGFAGALQLGVVDRTFAPVEPVGAPRLDALPALLAALPAPSPPGALDLEFTVDARLVDGRHGNCRWLQELPDPATRLTWDNAALVSPATAGRLGVATGDVVALSSRGRTVRAPALVLPGHADDAVSLSLGYGRGGLDAHTESVAANVGVDAYALRAHDAPWFAPGATLTRTGDSYDLAITQHHFDMEGRPHALATTVAELRREPLRFDEERGELPSMYAPYPYEGYRWAMAIDLSRCTGCSACVVACQAENNIPTVGREQVLRGREMHWLRIDRYYVGDAADPEVLNQPVACVHCEDAPCEYVCPVNATVHSDEGLNEMVYNRCVGTRYCSNNCPYKVRRFNYLRYNTDKRDVEKLLMNPDVTVRSRGVMEKCTYCVQRIEQARIRTRIEGREIRDGELQTACQQSCPTRAITFGTLSDPAARVTRLHRDLRRYDLLHDLGTRPRTAYLARVRNPHPDLAGGGS